MPLTVATPEWQARLYLAGTFQPPAQAQAPPHPQRSDAKSQFLCRGLSHWGSCLRPLPKTHCTVSLWSPLRVVAQLANNYCVNPGSWTKDLVTRSLIFHLTLELWFEKFWAWYKSSISTGSADSGFYETDLTVAVAANLCHQSSVHDASMFCELFVMYEKVLSNEHQPWWTSCGSPCGSVLGGGSTRLWRRHGC